MRTTQGEEPTLARMRRHVDRTREQWEQARLISGHPALRLRARRAVRAGQATQAQARLTHRADPAGGASQAPPARTTPYRCAASSAPSGRSWRRWPSTWRRWQRQARRKAAFLIATHVRDPTRWSDQELIQTDQDHQSVERGLALRKRSAVAGRPPSSSTSLSGSWRSRWSWCCGGTVYRLAEHRLREPLAVTGQPIKSQVNTPTDRPTRRWGFPSFEGGDRLPIRHGQGPDVALVLRLLPLPQQVLTLLGPASEPCYASTH